MPPDSHSNGNKYWENVEEQPGRTRWVDFKAHDYDSTQIDPLWHAWLSHTRLEPPSEDPLTDRFEKSWQQVRAPHSPQPTYENFTGTRGAFRTYNTTQPKLVRGRSWRR